MKYMIAFCIICLSFSELLAQYTPTKEQKMLVEKMISAYNK